MPDCRKAGPYLPVGDCDWVCRTHGDVVLIHLAYPGPFPEVIRKVDLRCPVADPHPGDPPLEYETRQSPRPA